VLFQQVSFLEDGVNLTEKKRIESIEQSSVTDGENNHTTCSLTERYVLLGFILNIDIRGFARYCLVILCLQVKTGTK
jgi:hypothetical protein